MIQTTRDYNILNEGLINYTPVITKRSKKGLIKGTSFSDVIEGSVKADKIKGGLGNDVIYGNLGNDKLYGGKGIDTFVFDTYAMNGKFYGSGKDTIYDAQTGETLKFEKSNIEVIKFSRSKKNLVITYFDKDSNGATSENTVTVRNYFKKNPDLKIVARGADGELVEFNSNALYNNEIDLTPIAQERAAIADPTDQYKIDNFNDLEDELETLQQNVSNLYKTVEGTDQEGTFADLQTSVNNLMSDYNTATTALGNIDSAVAAINVALENETDPITRQNLQARVIALNEAKEGLEGDLSTLEGQVKALNILIDSDTEEFDIDDLQDKIEDLQSVINAYEAAEARR